MNLHQVSGVVILFGCFGFMWYCCNDFKKFSDKQDQESKARTPTPTVDTTVCEPHVLTRRIQSVCCQDAFQTGLFDKDSVTLCGVQVMIARGCNYETMNLEGKIQCYNTGKGFPYNPCNDISDTFQKTSCNKRRNQIIQQNIKHFTQTDE